MSTPVSVAAARSGARVGPAQPARLAPPGAARSFIPPLRQPLGARSSGGGLALPLAYALTLQRALAEVPFGSSATPPQADTRSSVAGIPGTLVINGPGDPYEQEAEWVAEQVMSAPPSPTPLRRRGSRGIADPTGKYAAQRARQLGRQRQPRATASTSGIAPPIVHEVLNSPGQPLDAASRAFFEPRFGFDFSQVRIHADDRAAESARAVQAHAYAVGRHVVFGPDQHAPHSPEGRRLLAHELAHVVQQAARLPAQSPPRQPVVQAGLDVTPRLVQRQPVETQYSARNSSGRFLDDHVAPDAAGAQAATRNRARNGRGTVNTVITETEEDIIEKVNQADLGRTVHYGGSIWLVPVECSYIIVRAAHGADGVLIRRTGPETVGPVWLKVYFNEARRTFSITGVWGQD